MELMNVDIDEMYATAKILYKNVHVQITVGGIRIEQKVKDCCRDSYNIEIDAYNREITCGRKLRKSDYEKLQVILPDIGWTYPEKDINSRMRGSLK